MPNVAPQSRDKVVRALTRAYGCRLAREGGRHSIYVNAGIPEPIVLPRHREITAGVIRSICKILDVSVEEFLETLRHC
ncbi:MAG: type II toxin-antitoxin system HicA family toxin [Acidobacteria bacterium]|nr:type II toxin-antitoxin system HicA family toxin [Acidobacteriota bacterium]